MKGKLICIMVLILLAPTLVSADIINPGYRGISINNYISNINDFPDYVFVSGPSEGTLGMGMCSFRVIEDSGYVGSYYKFCSISVYAVSKSEFSMEMIEDMDKFNSLSKIEVISGLDTYTEVPESSSKESIENYFDIDLENVTKEPTKENIERNSLIYLYVGIPLGVLVIIVAFIIYRRKR